MSEFTNPYAPPAAEIVCLPQDPLKTGTIMIRAWRIYRERFWVIAFTVMLIWVPGELVSSYMDSFVFGEDDFRKSFKFAQFLENFFGIIATAGVIHVALHHSAGESTSFGQAVAAGLKAWPRMWWTRFLSTLVLVLSLLLLVVPFFYLYPRLGLVESVVVSEHVSGGEAMRRSAALVRGRYWQVAGIMLLLLGMMFLPIGAFIALDAFEIMPDHWVAEAALGVVFDVVDAYGTVCLFCMYEAFAGQNAQAVR
jgi:hypothetical protein